MVEFIIDDILLLDSCIFNSLKMGKLIKTDKMVYQKTTLSTANGAKIILISHLVGKLNVWNWCMITLMAP